MEKGDIHANFNRESADETVIVLVMLNLMEKGFPFTANTQAKINI